MPVALEKKNPHVDVETARAQVRAAIKRAIQVVGVGQVEMARKLTAALHARRPDLAAINPDKLRYWLYEGTFIDRDYWPPFEEVTDMAVTRRHLRPDLYPNG